VLFDSHNKYRLSAHTASSKQLLPEGRTGETSGPSNKCYVFSETGEDQERKVRLQSFTKQNIGTGTVKMIFNFNVRHPRCVYERNMGGV
jgi:hypothetical protein